MKAAKQPVKINKMASSEIQVNWHKRQHSFLDVGRNAATSNLIYAVRR